MVGRTKAPNKAEREHMAAVRAIGCICCKANGFHRLAEIHHVTDCGRRMGHMQVLPLCSWCHRGVPPEGYRPSEAEAVFGPSLALSKRAFVAAYGSEIWLLARVEALLREAA